MEETPSQGHPHPRVTDDAEAGQPLLYPRRNRQHGREAFGCELAFKCVGCFQGLLVILVAGVFFFLLFGYIITMLGQGMLIHFVNNEHNSLGGLMGGSRLV